VRAPANPRLAIDLRMTRSPFLPWNLR
jgi:hypothetical protein